MGTVADLGGNGRGELTGHAPPHGRRGVLIGQRPGRVIGRSGGAQQLVGGDARAGHRGQPLGEQRSELVVADLRGQRVEQLAPFLERRRVDAGDGAVEPSLPGRGGLLQLRCTGRSPVVDRDLHCGPPDLDVGDRGGLWPEAVLCPRRQCCLVGRPRSDLVGELLDQVSALGEVGAPVRVLSQAGRDRGHPRQRPCAGVAQAGGVQAPVEDRGAVVRGL